MKNFINLLIVLALQGCQQSGDITITELEGSWASNCTPTLKTNNENSIQFIPAKTYITYSETRVNIDINYYSDQDCITLLESVPVSETQLLPINSVPVTFSIDDVFITSTGVSTKELNHYNNMGELLPNIYLLQDNNTTLVYGVRCISAISTIPEICSSSRPTELEYGNFYIKS